MRGLLKKDILLLGAQKNFLLLIIAVSFVIGYNSDDGFAVSYLTFLSSFLVLGSFGYDENGDCTSFLLTLPVSRSGYVREKYVFGLLLTAGGWLIGELIDISMSLVRGSAPRLEQVGIDLACLMGFWLFISVLIPVVIKYGVERGRVALFFLLIVFLGLLYFGEKVLESAGVDAEVVLAKLLMWRQPLLLAGAVLGALLVMAASYGISLRVMKRKEF